MGLDGLDGLDWILLRSLVQLEHLAVLIIIIILIIITHSVRIQKGKAVVGRCSNIIIISILVIIFCTNIMVSPDPKRQGCSRQVQPSPPSEPNLASGPAKMPAATAII